MSSEPTKFKKQTADPSRPRAKAKLSKQEWDLKWIFKYEAPRKVLLLLGRHAPSLSVGALDLERDAGPDWELAVDALIDMGYVEFVPHLRGWKLKRPDGEPAYHRVFMENHRGEKDKRTAAAKSLDADDV